MKIKTSVTLSDEILKAIDLHIGAYRSRSEFLETAARIFIEQIKKKEAEQRDLELINKNADSLNNEADDVLAIACTIGFEDERENSSRWEFDYEKENPESPVMKGSVCYDPPRT